MANMTTLYAGLLCRLYFGTLPSRNSLSFGSVFDFEIVRLQYSRKVLDDMNRIIQQCFIGIDQLELVQHVQYIKRSLYFDLQNAKVYGTMYICLLVGES